MYAPSVLNNVLFMLNRTTHSSKTLLRLVRFYVNKTLLRGVKSAFKDPSFALMKPCHFIKLDVAASRIASFDLNLHVIQVATLNSKN